MNNELGKNKLELTENHNVQQKTTNVILKIHSSILKKTGIILSEQNQCDPGLSTTNTGSSKEENTKKVELNVKIWPKRNTNKSWKDY